MLDVPSQNGYHPSNSPLPPHSPSPNSSPSPIKKDLRPTNLKVVIPSASQQGNGGLLGIPQTQSEVSIKKLQKDFNNNSAILGYRLHLT